MKVHKFGGASIRDAHSIRNLARVLDNPGQGVGLLVVSAMAKTTNALEEVVEAYFEERETCHKLLDRIKHEHFAIAYELGISGDSLSSLNDLFVEIEWLLDDEPQDEYAYLYDQMVAVGELASTTIVHAYLQQIGRSASWMDIRGILITDDNYREAKVDWEKTKHRVEEYLVPILRDERLVITQGFIGGTIDNNTTTLGREGSDFSAAVLSALLNVTELTLWKDVAGVFTADPKVDPQATLLHQLSYGEAIEMTYYGAKILHPKTLKPLMNRDIPIRVRPFGDVQHRGSTIGNIGTDQLRSITMEIKDLTLLHVTPKDHDFVVENHLRDIFSLVSDRAIKIHFMRNQAMQFTMLTETSPQIHLLVEALKPDYDLEMLHRVNLTTILYPKSTNLELMKNGKQILIEEGNHTMTQLVWCDL